MIELQPPAAPIRVSITGHRPQKLTATKEEIAQALATVFRALHAGVVHQGMAAGVDLTAAVAAHREGIPHVAHYPWAGHRNSIPNQWRDLHAWVSRNAAQVLTHNPSKAFPGNSAYFARNAHLVDNADIVVAVWDGVPAKSGTAHAIRLAVHKGIPVYHITPDGGLSGWLSQETRDALR